MCGRGGTFAGSGEGRGECVGAYGRRGAFVGCGKGGDCVGVEWEGPL